jgi:dGTPase
MIHTRDLLEAWEDRRLAAYGLRSRDTRGRAFPEDEPRHRTVFQRDRDRILHTTAFRRLEYKTQVFVIYEGDYYRTRLTHTLEVAQIGRTLARALAANEDLTEAICLAHDLGHPPFGHAGEAALSQLMRESGGFDHNRQSMRIVTELERRFPDFPGLNLTWEVREGIVKHETEYDLSEAGDYDPDLRGHFEAQLANVADELAYTAHDLDDGLRSGLLEPGTLGGLTIWRRLQEQTGWKEGPLDDLLRHRIIRRLIGIEVGDLLAETNRLLEASGVDSVSSVQRQRSNLVSFSPAQAAENRQLKDFLYQNMYRHPHVVQMQQNAERTIAALFHAYSADPALLPPEVLAREVEGDIPRLICDYVAGMTDRFADQELVRIRT